MSADSTGNGKPATLSPSELILLQIVMETLQHIANYSPVSHIQPVMIARDTLKKIETLELGTVATLAAKSQSNAILEALKPLAEAADAFDDKIYGDAVKLGTEYLTLGMLRKARNIYRAMSPTAAQ